MAQDLKAEGATNALREGVVLVSHGNRGRVRLNDGEELAAHYRRGVGRPVCGDVIRLENNHDGTAVVAEIAGRSNVFARSDSRQRKQVVAANLDLVLIVLARQPAPSRDLLERYLVAAHSLGITPAIVINKVDLPDAGPADSENPFARRHEYEDLGYQVVMTTCKTEPGVGALQDLLTGRTSILVGQSGVGKSSLVNQLVPDLDIQTGALSDSTGKGRHTTTSTMMYQLPGGSGTESFLIDSPGVWEYGLWKLEPDELESGFIEFRPFLGQCRFNDCRHVSEPDCAVKSAVANGRVREWRYQAYVRLLREQ